ncbi:MAG: GWxTD domain-containing protein [Acidobacteria bacterium]|nr:GWxTD domain-containing protein [Acidobacteriota bacterium]
MRVLPKVPVFVLVFTIGAVLSSPILLAQKRGKGKGEDADRQNYYKKWLEEDVVYIISEDEKKVFKQLQTDEERESFIEQFWIRRDPDPRTPDNEFKEEHYARIAYANERFASGIPGWKTDRGRIYITFGKPAEIESHPSGGTYNREYWEGGGTTATFPFERWRYRHIDGIGDDIEIEFVDKSMSGEYKMAMSPDEKDALMMVPGAGLTLNEELGISTKADRPYFNPSNANDPSKGGYMRAKDQPFQRMEQYFNLFRPPQIKFEDLKAVFTTNVTFNMLPYDVRVDYIRLGSDKVLVPITIELQNRELEFKKELDFNRAIVNVYGIVTGLTGRILAEFEHVITNEYLDEHFDTGKQSRSIYQKIVGLPPGQRFKLDLVLKDVNSGRVGHYARGLVVPKYDPDLLQASSVILANSITPVPTNTDQLEQFVLGDLKVQPNVKAVYKPGQNLIPYVQIYNATIDQTSLKPAIEVTYTIKSGDRIVEQLQDLAGSSVQFFSGQRVVVIGSIPLKGIASGDYKVEISVQDLISNRSLTTAADFKVLDQPVTTASVQH